MFEEWLFKLDPQTVTWAFAALGLGVLFRGPIGDLVRGWIEDRRAARTERREEQSLERSRVDALNNLGDTFQTMVTSMNGLNAGQMQTNALMVRVEQSLKDQGEAMQHRVEQTATKLDAIHTDVRGTPSAVWAASGDPLKTLAVQFEQSVAGLEARILASLDSNALNASQVVRTEFAEMRQKWGELDTRLRDISGMVLRLLPAAEPAPAPQEPGEAVEARDGAQTDADAAKGAESEESRDG